MGKTLSTRHDKGELVETPPRAWGRPLLSELSYASARNTPTCMGKTGAAAGAEAGGRKHPHVHGEDFYHIITLYKPWETPPRAWGRLDT